MKSNEQEHIIYMHQNKINGKVYIGQTIYANNPEVRWKKQGQGYSKQPVFYQEIQKYGWDNFTHIILETGLSATEATQKEKEYIAKFDATDPNKGYNRNPESGTVSPETRAKMSENWHEKSPTRAKSASDNMKLYNATRIYPTGEAHPRFGDHTKTGADAHRKRAVQCIETGEIFPTLTLASQWCNPGGSNLRSHIAAQIQGKRNYCGRHPETGEKLHWRYIDKFKESENNND